MGDWGEVIGGPKVWARDLALAVVVGVAIALVGPFGTYGAPLELRILTSVSYGLAGSVVLWPFMRLVRRLGERAGLPEWFTLLAGLVLAAVPVTGAVRLVSALLHPGQPLPELVEHYFGVLAIVFPVGLVMLLYERQTTSSAPATPAAGPATPRLIGRLPVRLGRDLIALQAEDHYVRVHTAAGSDLLLMRLADAIAEAEGVEGLRVHRSWWVARSAVAGGRTEGRRAVLSLTNGLAVPVSRDAVPAVRRAGWL
jgi:hypothetical protein